MSCPVYAGNGEIWVPGESDPEECSWHQPATEHDWKQQLVQVPDSKGPRHTTRLQGENSNCTSLWHTFLKRLYRGNCCNCCFTGLAVFSEGFCLLHACTGDGGGVGWGALWKNLEFFLYQPELPQLKVKKLTCICRPLIFQRLCLKQTSGIILIDNNYVHHDKTYSFFF